MGVIRFIVLCGLVAPLLATGQGDLSNSYYNRADSSIQAGNYAEAISFYKLFIEAEAAQSKPDWPKVSESYNNIGVACFRTRDFDAAMEAFTRAVDIEKTYGLDNLSSRLSNLGMVYKKLGFYDRAISYYQEALKLAEEKDNTEHVAIFLNNIGSIYDSWGKYNEAIDYYQRSLRFKEQAGNKEGIATSLNNIGMVYNSWEKYDQAIINFKEALEIDKELDNKNQMAVRLNNIGLSFYSQKNYDSALYYYQEALNINIELGVKDQIATQYNNIGMVYFKKKDHYSAGEFLNLALKIYEELKLKNDIATVLSNLGYNEGYKKNYDKAFEYLLQSNEIAREMKLQNQLHANLEKLSEISYDMKNYALALQYYKEAMQIKDSIFTEATHQQIADFEVKYETQKKEKEIELLQQNEIISNLEIKRQKVVKDSLIVGIVLIFLLAAVSYWALRQRIHDNRIIAGEKAKSDKLLLNILPVKVAHDLKESGATIPESFDNVSVLFTDLVSFTSVSSSLEPKYIINELNEMFSRFDAIMERHKCERIKTIGDAYMAVCGLPEPDADHAVNIVNAAVEILHYMNDRAKRSQVKWQIRIGIDSGIVVAGVVGVKKYIYDVFGDTVNTASRMQSHSEPMRITISENTFSLVKEKIPCIQRDTVEIKGKGQLKTYFVNES